MLISIYFYTCLVKFLILFTGFVFDYRTRRLRLIKVKMKTTRIMAMETIMIMKMREGMKGCWKILLDFQVMLLEVLFLF